MDDPHHGIYITNLFDRYTILLDVAKDRTAVYCEYCEQWVAEFDGDALTSRAPDEFLEVVEQYHQDNHATKVRFQPWTERFK